MIKNKKTKIVCTVSDQRCSVEFIKELYDAGMNVVRINSAHASIEDATTLVNNVRSVSNKIALLVDTKGPETRLTQMKDKSGYEVKTDDIVEFLDNPEALSTKNQLFTSYAHFVNDVPLHSEILIDDGALSMTVIEKSSEKLTCKINNDGILLGRKSINVPGVSIKLPAVTEKDRKYIQWAVENNIDFIAHSFVRSQQDLHEVQSIIDEVDSNSSIKIISKIENQEGVDNIEDILSKCYGIMIARGDLGIEIPAEKIPVIQKRIIKRCRIRKRPVIVATQMLHTMIDNPRPTRAEISDVATAIMGYTDAIMLSGETAYGKYPKEAVETMSRVALEVESYHSPKSSLELQDIKQPIAAILAQSLVEASEKITMRCFIIDTLSGRTARYLSAYRPNIPTYAQCYTSSAMRHLSLSYGVYGELIDRKDSKEEFERETVEKLITRGDAKETDTIGVLAGNFGDTTGASFIEIAHAKNMIKKNK